MKVFIFFLFLFVFILLGSLFLTEFIRYAQAEDLRDNFQNAVAVETVDEGKNKIIKRLEEMDKALTRIENAAVQEIKSDASVILQMEADKSNLPKADPIRDKTSQVFVVHEDIGNVSNGAKEPAKEKLNPEKMNSAPAGSPVKSRGARRGIFLLTGLALFFGLGILIIRYLKNKWKAQFDNELAEVKLQLREKEERLNQEKIIRHAIEQAQKQKEKDYSLLKSSFESLQSELERKNEILAQKEAVIEEKEQSNLQKEQECAEFRKIIEALKEALVKRKIMGKSLSAQEGDRPWIPGDSAERRELNRLDLSRDYSRSVLLRIDSYDKSKTTKCFAGNISFSGLYFESEAEFKEKEILRLRLFFFGDKVPMMRVKAEVVWVKESPLNNHYGLFLLFQEEKNKAELKEYIESHMVK